MPGQERFDSREWQEVLYKVNRLFQNHYGYTIVYKHHEISLGDEEVVCVNHPSRKLYRFRQQHRPSPRQNRDPSASYLPTQPFLSYNYVSRLATHMGN